ncbi:MAG TPA: hypothetical protein VN673_08840 [Clostridia bacterium]|nr:hypothetical protein [Clostridia bacterium]
MASLHEYKRRSLVPLVVLALAAYYLLVFLPLSRRAAKLDEPLQQGWTQLSAAMGKTNAARLNFNYITNQLAETRQTLARLSEASQQASARVELPAVLQERMSSRFQLVDYQNELSKQMDELDRRAKEQKIAVDPVVFAGFPEHNAAVDERKVALLWAALFFTDGLLETTLKCRVEAIHSLKVQLASNDGPGQWAEVPLEIEFSASAASANLLIRSLPLRADEIKAAKLPDSGPSKVPLLLDRLIIRKEKPEKLDEVRVWLQVVGFVRRG